MYETILVPMDGSPRAEKILPHVERMAQRLNSLIILLQVIDLSTVELFADSAEAITVLGTIEQQTAHVRTYLSTVASALEAKGLRVQIEIEYGPPVATIIDVAKRKAVSLIAMASHGRTGLAHVFYGSITAGLLHRLDRPLLLIRAGAA